MITATVIQVCVCVRVCVGYRIQHVKLYLRLCAGVESASDDSALSSSSRDESGDDSADSDLAALSAEGIPDALEGIPRHLRPMAIEALMMSPFHPT